MGFDSGNRSSFSKVDPLTQQPLFHPQILSYSANKASNRLTDGQSAHDYLYSKHSALLEKKKMLLNLKAQEIQEPKAKPSKNSSLLAEAIKTAKVEKIFDVLDSDGDGVISKEKINIEALPPQVVEIFTPLFLEMEEMNLSLNKQHFVDASEKLFKAFNAPQKNLTLLGFGKGAKRGSYEPLNPSFKVRAVPLSNKLVYFGGAANNQ